MLVNAHMIQPVMAFRRSVSAVAAATTPTEALSLHPQGNRPAHDTHDQQTVQRHKNRVHDGENPHLNLERACGCASIASLARRPIRDPHVCEHLDRMDVGVAIDHPTR